MNAAGVITPEHVARHLELEHELSKCRLGRHDVTFKRRRAAEGPQQAHHCALNSCLYAGRGRRHELADHFSGGCRAGFGV